MVMLSNIKVMQIKKNDTSVGTREDENLSVSKIYAIEDDKMKVLLFSSNLEPP